MINTIKPILQFSILLLIVLSIVFGIHLAILSYFNYPLFENMIIASYIVNYLLAFIIFIALYFLRKKYLDLLGFIFMGGSFLKFGVFFIFFFPVFKQNGEINTLESVSFLLPYITCLILETIYVSRLLNNKL